MTNTITVKELVALLNTLPEDAEIRLFSEEGAVLYVDNKEETVLMEDCVNPPCWCWGH